MVSPLPAKSFSLVFLVAHTALCSLTRLEMCEFEKIEKEIKQIWREIISRNPTKYSNSKKQKQNGQL